MDLSLDELAVLIQFQAGRRDVNGHILPEAANRISELSELLQEKQVVLGRVTRARTGG